MTELPKITPSYCQAAFFCRPTERLPLKYVAYQGAFHPSELLPELLA